MPYRLVTARSWAKISFPVPLWPLINTLTSDCATSRACSSKRSISGLRVTIASRQRSSVAGADCRETLRSFGRYELTTAYTPAGQLQSQHLNSLLSDRDYTWNDNGELIRISSPRQTRKQSGDEQHHCV